MTDTDDAALERARVRSSDTREALVLAIQQAILKRAPDAGGGCWLDVLDELNAFTVAVYREGKLNGAREHEGAAT